MAGEAITRAIQDAGIEPAAVSALYLGNMTAGVLERQQQLASLCAHACSLTCAEAFTLEASSASGAAALRTGFMAVAGGFHDVVVVCGAERLSHAPREASSQRAFRQAGIIPHDIDVLELHDAYTVITALSLESNGFAAPGEAALLGKDGALALDGRLPISTMGGLKSRGHPVGATGMYQVVEAVQQLRGTAGANQVRNAAVAMTQNLGGMGATAITHVLEAA